MITGKLIATPSFLFEIKKGSNETEKRCQRRSWGHRLPLICRKVERRYERFHGDNIHTSA